MSVAQMTKKGNRVNLSEHDPHVIHIKTGQRTALRREGNVFVMDLWVKVPAKGKTQESERVPMDVGNVAPFGRQGK